MATDYDTIIPLIRAAIGDFGIRDGSGVVVQNSEDWHDDDIDKAITLLIPNFEGFSGNGSEITPDLSTSEQSALACYVGMHLTLQGGTFSLEVPNMRYYVQANQELISHLMGLMDNLLNERDIGPSIWGTLDQKYNEVSLMIDRITEAVGAY